MHGKWIAAVLPLLLLPVVAAAQMNNGDFDLGSTGWTFSIGGSWSVTFPDSGGNPQGMALITSPGADTVGGMECIQQTFTCGTGSDTSMVGKSCRIVLDYDVFKTDSTLSYTGRVQVYLDDRLIHTSAPSDSSGWVTFSYLAPCGTHTLKMCLEVDPGSNGQGHANRWSARFDNVASQCVTSTPVEPSTWGAIKAKEQPKR